MGEIQLLQQRRPLTPHQTLDAWLNESPDQDQDHDTSPTQRLLPSSPRESVGGNLSSLSSRNSSLSRSQSKASLRSFFSRGRSASVASQRPDLSTSRGRPAGRSEKHSRQSSVTIARVESPHPSQIGSRLDSHRPSQVTHATHVERARAQQQKARRRPTPSWDPPPLFQAYPQALKHAVLDVSCLPIDVILRKSPNRDGRTTKEASKADPLDTAGVEARLTKTKENKHARQLSASLSSSGWAKHLFILLESGHLLQYAGSGHHDRLPEKMMQLGEDTVAFASDAIPGRHWVLQVSQADRKDATIASGAAKGILSRIGVRSSESRRTTQNFLLVFDNADELDAWLTAIRREVEALGGRPYGLDTPADVTARHSESPSPVQMPGEPNESYRFPGNQFAGDYQDSSPVRSEYLEPGGGQTDRQTHDFRFWDHEAASRKASEDSSAPTSTDLDRLRDSKDSSRSTNTGASAGLPRVSPSSSPGSTTFAWRPFPPFESAHASVVPASQPGASHAQESDVDEPQSPTFFCHALDGSDIEDATPRVSRGGAPNRKKLYNATPNFSVPMSSNRFSFSGPSEAANVRTSRCTTSANSPIAEHGSWGDEGTEDENENFSRRPVSTIAPLPTAEALMNPAGTRTRALRRPSAEKSLSSQPVPDRSPITFTRSSDATDSLPGDAWTTAPKRSSLSDHNLPLQSSPFPGKKVVPALQRSKSSQGLLTFYNSGKATVPPTLTARPSPDRPLLRPLSLSGFPEPPSSGPSNSSSPTNPTALAPSAPVKPLVSSSRASLAAVGLTGMPAPVQSRLGLRCNTGRVLALGIRPPSGPPPTCPLPATPSPRKRHFQL